MFIFVTEFEHPPPSSSGTKKPTSPQIHEKSNILSDDLKVRQDKELM
jgi:hypothetical protein